MKTYLEIVDLRNDVITVSGEDEDYCPTAQYDVIWTG